MALTKEVPNIKSSILRRIEESPENSIFFISDFLEFGSMPSVKKTLRQALSLGIISHVAHGIYVKPMASRFGEVPPSLEKIAKEIAQRDRVEIMPSGSTAANILGLSTQVPMVVSYLTTGSSRTIKIGKRAIKFRHAAPRNFAYAGTTIPLVVQAFKELEADNIGEKELSVLHKYLSDAPDKDTFQKDIILAPQWIQSIVKPIIKTLQDETLATV